MKKFKKYTAGQKKIGEDFANRKRLMKFNRFFANYRVFTTIYVAGGILFLVILTIVLNQLENMSWNSLFSTSTAPKSPSTLADTIQSSWQILAVAAVFVVILYGKFAYNVRVSHGDTNIGQKGTARWTTREELNQQYIKVEALGGVINGCGGFPVSWDNNQILIDDTTTNNLIIGGTRSGKGEMYVKPMAEILSRAEEKCSMVFTDPKLELASQMIPELEKRGYECHLLNLVDPEYSMGYNPLSLIINEYKRGNIDTAQLLCSSLAHTVFADNPEEKDPYWKNQARNVFIAAVWADICDNLEADRKENLRRKYAHEKEEAAREEAYARKLYGDRYEDFVIHKKIRHILETEPDLSDRGILFELRFLSDKQELNQPEELTEERIRQLREFPGSEKYRFVKKEYIPATENEKKINLYSIIKMCNHLSSVTTGKNRTALDDFFDDRSEEDFARITYGSVISAAETTKGTIMSTFKIGVTIFTYDSIAKMTAESTLDFANVGFGKKPVAIFIGIPDYDASNHFLATVFLNQMYFILAKLATAMPGGKLPRRVHFILDEFGNLPPLDHLGNIVTVCLGRNILFSFFVQSLQQLDKLYPDDRKTIEGNCGNQVYIMSGDLETCKEVSEKLGNETISVVNRTGKKLALNKELTEMNEEKPLLTPDELMRLEMGETIVFRFMFRETRTGDRQRIKAAPIANLGKYKMKYAFEYLTDLFPPKQQLYVSPNMEQIYEIDTDYETIIKPIVAVNLETTGGIDHQKRSRSATQYLQQRKWNHELFPASQDQPFAQVMRMNRIFDLMNLTKEERECYMLAAVPRTDQKTGELLYDRSGQLLVTDPDIALRNGQIVDYAWLLVTIHNPDVIAKGYEILDIMIPLPGKAETQEEQNQYAQREREILKQIKEE